MSLSIKKTGIIETSLFTEFIANTFDTTTYTEPDGSAWIRIVHHNNPGTSNLFASGDTFTTQVYKDANRWFNASLCNYLSGSWEFMIKQTATSGATEYKYRWIQTINPMVAAWADVASANITKITTSGYTTFSTGGLYHHGSNTYLCTNNGTQGNWWGAVGSWGTHQSGIPAWAGVVVTTGYCDLYLRIDNAKANLNATSFGTNFVKSKEIIEV